MFSMSSASSIVFFFPNTPRHFQKRPIAHFCTQTHWSKHLFRARDIRSLLPQACDVGHGHFDTFALNPQWVTVVILHHDVSITPVNHLYQSLNTHTKNKRTTVMCLYKGCQNEHMKLIKHIY